MRKFSLITSIASAALILSGSSFAASVNNGVITPDACPTGGTCGTPVTGNGFLQREVKIGTDTYYETYITPDNATSPDITTLAFFDVSTVKRGAAGIKDHQGITESLADGTNFTSNSQINMGWANTGASPTVSLEQTVAQGAGFNSTFNFSQTNNAAGAVLGKTVDINQTADLSMAGTPGSQTFTHHSTSGAATLAGGDTLPNGASISWADGDDVAYNTVFQTIGTPGVDQTQFNFEGYKVVDSAGAEHTANYFSF